jgi:ketosteroid isomerase-like protein
VGFRLVGHVAPGFTVDMSIESNTRGIHDSTLPLATVAEQHPAVFAETFNTGDLKAMTRLYAPGAVFVPEPGRPTTGDALTGATADFLALGLPISVQVRHAYVVDDTALLIVDWTIDGPGPDGGPVSMRGTATDVVRRGPDGRWRFLIDNPFGTAGQAPEPGWSHAAVQ